MHAIRLKYGTADTCQQCGLSLRAHHFDDKLCYWEHHTVKLVEGFEKHDAQAGKGPLPPNRLGTIVAIDIRPGVYDVLKPYKVSYKGQTWWYARKALQPATLDDVPPDLPDDAAAPAPRDAQAASAPAPALDKAAEDHKLIQEVAGEGEGAQQAVASGDGEAQERIRCCCECACRALACARRAPSRQHDGGGGSSALGRRGPPWCAGLGHVR